MIKAASDLWGFNNQAASYFLKRVTTFVTVPAQSLKE